MDSVIAEGNTCTQPANRPVRENTASSAAPDSDSELFDELLDRQTATEAVVHELSPSTRTLQEHAAGYQGARAGITATETTTRSELSSRLETPSPGVADAGMPYRFDLLDGASGIRGMHLVNGGPAGWSIRLLAERWSRDELRRHAGELAATLDDRQHVIASISLVDVDE